jgi:hypothetical protein
MTLRRELLAPRHDLLMPHGQQRRPGDLEAFSVGALHPFRPLQVYEVLQRRLIEGQQAKLHSRRVPPRLMRHMRPAYIVGRPD